MNYGGDDVISRATRASGRSLLALATAIILVDKLEVDVSQLQLMGIDVSAQQVSSAAWVVLLLLIIVHTFNWVGDFIALASWNSVIKEKAVETVWDGSVAQIP